MPLEVPVTIKFNMPLGHVPIAMSQHLEGIDDVTVQLYAALVNGRLPPGVRLALAEHLAGIANALFCSLPTAAWEGTVLWRLLYQHSSQSNALTILRACWSAYRAADHDQSKQGGSQCNGKHL